MNVGNILKVADAIEQASNKELGFNMAVWRGREEDTSGRGCGTTACIAGWTCEVAGMADLEGWLGTPAQRFLELDDVTAEKLFLIVAGQNEDTVGLKHRHDITDVQAVRALRNLAITGKVDWEAAMKANEPAMPSLPGPLPAKRERV